MKRLDTGTDKWTGEESRPPQIDVFDHGLPAREMFRMALGDEAYLKLLEYRGGCRIDIPKDVARSRLTRIIGEEGARKLAVAFMGGVVVIPLDREFRAVQLRRKGKSNRQIALALGVTENAVVKIFMRLRAREKRSAGK